MALDFNIDVLSVVQWSPLWFSAPTDLNRILGTELKIKEYHEVVNGVFHGRYSSLRNNLQGKHTPKSCMLTSVARVLQHKPRERGIHKEMKGWQVKEETHTLFFFLMEVMKKNKALMNDLRRRQPRPLMTKEPCTRRPCRIHARPTGKEKDLVLRKQQRFGKRSRRRKMKGGKVESGTAQRKRGSSNPREAAEDKAQ